MPPVAKLVNILFSHAPHTGKNTVLMAEVDQDAEPGHPLPEPQPPDPDAPRPEHPICLPGMPCWGQDLIPSHPICLPGMACWEPPPDVEVPPEPPVTIPATVSPVPPGVTPPEAPSPDATVCIIDFGPDAKAATGRRTAFAWVNPMVIHHGGGPGKPPAE